MLVSGDVSGSVNYVYPAGLPFAAAGFVEALLVRAGELGGVRQAAHGRGGHGSLSGSERGV